MRLTVIAIGRLKTGPEQDLCKRYTTRLSAMGKSVALGPLETIEYMESRAGTSKQRKADEAELLLKAVKPNSIVVALDEHGKHKNSEDFASFLSKRRDDGCPNIAFLIGGADGHGDAVLKRADLKFSLSALTMPHGLARVHLTEQLYRAATILSGHPYHRS